MQFCQRCFALVRQGEQQCRSCGAAVDVTRSGAGEGAERDTRTPAAAPGEAAFTQHPGPSPALPESSEPGPSWNEAGAASLGTEAPPGGWGLPATDAPEQSNGTWEEDGAWNGEMAEQASRLNSLPTSYSERLILQSSEEEERVPQTAVEAFLQGGVTWLRRLIYVGVVTALLTAMTTTLIRRNRASQAESFVKAQIGAKQLERQQELREAHKALQELYAELKEQGGVDPAGSESARAWRILWRQRLQEVVMRYRLDGQVDFTRTHATAEAVLRDAQLYLHSLEREWVSSVDASSPLSQKLDECLKEARDDLY